MEPENAVEIEVFERLNDATVKDLTPNVFQHVPQDHKLKDPGDAVVVIGEVVSRPFGGGTKDDGDDDIEGDLTIVVIQVAEERAPIWKFRKAIKARLDKWNADRDGWRVSLLYKDASGFYDDEDDAYVGIFKFTFAAIAAA